MSSFIKVVCIFFENFSSFRATLRAICAINTVRYSILLTHPRAPRKKNLSVISRKIQKSREHTFYSQCQMAIQPEAGFRIFH